MILSGLSLLVLEKEAPFTVYWYNLGKKIKPKKLLVASEPKTSEFSIETWRRLLFCWSEEKIASHCSSYWQTISKTSVMITTLEICIYQRMVQPAPSYESVINGAVITMSISWRTLSFKWEGKQNINYLLMLHGRLYFFQFRYGGAVGASNEMQIEHFLSFFSKTETIKVHLEYFQSNLCVQHLGWMHPWSKERYNMYLFIWLVTELRFEAIFLRIRTILPLHAQWRHLLKSIWRLCYLTSASSTEPSHALPYFPPSSVTSFSGSATDVSF